MSHTLGLSVELFTIVRSFGLLATTMRALKSGVSETLLQLLGVAEPILHAVGLPAGSIAAEDHLDAARTPVSFPDVPLGSGDRDAHAAEVFAGAGGEKLNLDVGLEGVALGAAISGGVLVPGVLLLWIVPGVERFALRSEGEEGSKVEGECGVDGSCDKRSMKIRMSTQQGAGRGGARRERTRFGQMVKTEPLRRPKRSRWEPVARATSMLASHICFNSAR
jgi:hypothetical protein